MDDAVRAYIEAIPTEYRPLFEWLHGLIMSEHPDAQLLLSYGIPTYKVGKKRLYLGAWKHGISIYGWRQAEDLSFTARHPELMSGKGTIHLRPQEACTIPDDELRDLFRSVMQG